MPISEVGTSPNPWKLDLGPLPQPKWDLEKDGHPLSIMRNILLQWPGEETVNLRDDVRHERLIRTVSGYPLIDVGRVPFDWPMHPKSIEALRISEFFDNIASPFPDISVRSAILNADMHYRGNPEKICRIHKKCLAMIFKSLRDYIGCYPSKFIKEEILFLATLHGTDNSSSFPWWPWKEMDNEYVKTYHLEPSDLVPLIESNDEWDKATPKEKSLIQDSSNWKKFQNYWNEEDIQIGFEPKKKNVHKIEFVKIQSWIEDWVHHDALGSTSQRILRGLSAIVEAIISRIRHLVINKFGVGSIIIDGGGRMKFLVFDDTKPESWAEEIFNSFRIWKDKEVSFEPLLPIHNTQAKELMIIHQSNEHERLSDTFDLLLGNKFSKRHFPPFKIFLNDNEFPSFEAEYKDPKLHLKCEICQNINSTGEENWDERINSPKMTICIFHKLLYKIGQATRKYDASIRKFGSPWKDYSKNTDRTVVAVSRIDLNSLGILFTTPFDTNRCSSIDISRRRSFRFNAKWWQAVQKTIDCEDRKIDSIAAWVAAGDDIVIAQYVFVNNEKFDEEPLLNCFNDLDRHLESFFSEEIDMELSFCAGYTKKGDNQDDKKDDIGKMVSRAGKVEQLLKDIWKTRMRTDAPKLLKMNESSSHNKNKGENELKKFCSKRIGQGELPIRAGKSMKMRYSSDFDNECQNEDKEMCKDGSECSKHSKL
jgi:hypothetical protein